ncbi:Hypothetical protein CpCap5W_1508 [Corynebacterium pseudotuberculosis]|nr:hypothetical protein [Corynebacterium pseudotuberculosis]AEK92514.1 Hypothetical protein CpPAT10_1174 [Corynebacterium pseudotuberculosis PAT10]AEP70424.1 Hypothetical protein Cp4202_1168 [Corynebacterium pseudotuberculosis 42/02-A]AEX39667.1 Hypothetical protein Cp3995_1203 [Corynebacterium pseudotuberculosis 3/99-5]AFF22335.1 Hypothetical protein CpP54B96_1198 [Corynebacterium pseudotuberculosis P54B96]AFH52130.1 Hypothetical protein Cp267_1231 [Corynebacterium pseudotuberculosis 267]
MAPLRYMTTSYVQFYGITVMSLLSIKAARSDTIGNGIRIKISVLTL